MATAKLHLYKLIQDSQEYGSDDEHMVSRVFFDLEIDGKDQKGLYVDIKQIVGSLFESSPLEISMPANYKGPFNYDAFCKIVERYFRSQVGAIGSGIHIEGGSNIRMRNNTFMNSVVEEFEVNLTDDNTW